MKHFSLRASLLALAVLSAAPAFSQTSELKVATGECTKDSCSTYVTMFRELKQRCTSDSLTLTEVTSKGSVESVDKLLNNELNAAVAQTDVLFSRKRTEDLSNIFTLVALHPEEVHFIAPVDSGQKSGGFGIGSVKVKQDAVTFTNVDSLTGYRVGAVQGSGSAVTAKLINDEGGIKYELVRYADSAKLRAALDAGEIQAAVYVGGSPLPAIASYNSNYKLLPFSANLITLLKDIYRPASLTYSNINAAGVKSVATEANLVTRGYKTPRMVAALSGFRACALAAIPELKETTGTHKKWQQVQEDNHGKWPWYELPVATAPAAAAPVAAPAKKK